MKYYFLALGTLVVVCVGCVADGQQIGVRPDEYHAPPPQMQMRPGPMVDGPGPGVLSMLTPPQASALATQTTQIRFVGQDGMQIGWQIDGGYAENQKTVPARYNFTQGATYRLKFSQIPNRDERLALYPTLQVYPTHPSTDAYLAHNSVPVELTPEDLDQVEANNFVTKVIYLPDAKFQDLAIANVETLVSTQLDLGVDPVAEADRRGTIMAILRMGNMDLEMPGGDGKISQMSYRTIDGDAGNFEPPMPIGGTGAGMMGVPHPMIVGSAGAPGMPAYNPVAGANGVPMWGRSITGTPIGLPGPPHLPYGGPASLKSHTVRNLTDHDVGRPVDHMLIDVKHNPGIRMPHPVKHIEYTESHPVHSAGERSWPRFANPLGN